MSDFNGRVSREAIEYEKAVNTYEAECGRTRANLRLDVGGEFIAEASAPKGKTA